MESLEVIATTFLFLVGIEPTIVNVLRDYSAISLEHMAFYMATIRE